MKFLYSPYSVEAELDENHCCVLQIENQKAFVDLLNDLYSQVAIGIGDSVLSDGEKSIDIKKGVELILEPFTIDLNNRKIKGKVYQEIAEIGLQEYYSEYSVVLSEINSFIGQLIASVPYSLMVQGNMGIDELLKVNNVLLDYEYESIAEKISVYMKLLSKACGINIVILADLNKYISDNDIYEILKDARYNKINLILINSSDMNTNPEVMNRYILDESLCFWKA